ncbi:mitochondrial carrier domain-containing protein [Kockovaella imperatae]|uniref:Mitochondrial carrier domain-containing protein n=1 Tax=Kockovaella imperatae TaxID=4999 RepID=A0A1Y1UT13_9TREE|nr:mitochondrial carrier domain-containing protein [Kockovaella imperatae]ORX41150.1 mitochondrial carrier domain-containing protein [Kockovaella imperatae]
MSAPITPSTAPEKGIVNPPGTTLVKKPYPFWLGGVAASLAASVTHPLDLTKVRLQTSGDKGMLNSMRKTVAANGFTGLFDGLTGTLLRQMTYSMMRFAVYDAAKEALQDGPGPMPAWRMALAGSIAGGVAGVFGNPAELMMVRMQADKAKPPEKRYNYRNSIQGLYRMTQQEGIASWYRGVVPNGFRAVLMNMSQLASYDWFKEQLISNKLLTDGPVCHFVASLGAGTVATTVCSPADVLKSRIMNAQGAGTTSTIAVIRQSLAAEGPMFMFKGWVPAWMRLQPTTILIFLILEQLKSGIDKYRQAGGKAL